MRLLLDTHVLIWLIEGLEELALASRDVIDEAARAHGGVHEMRLATRDRRLLDYGEGGHVTAVAV